LTGSAKDVTISTREVGMLSVVNRTVLSANWRDDENLLTAEVFGLLRYLSPQRLLWPVVAQAADQEGRRLGEWLKCDSCPVAVDVAFEREFASASPDAPLSRPDVHLSFRGEDGGCILDLVVEVKLRSAQSPHNDSELPQLARYLNVIAEQRSWVRPRALLYLTAHTSRPNEDLVEARTKAPTAGSVGLFWTSWFDFADGAFEAQSRDGSAQPPVIQDLVRVLELRGFKAREALLRFPLCIERPLPEIETVFPNWPIHEDDPCPRTT
jgi:hypothetical protein